MTSNARSAHHPRFHYRLGAALQSAGYKVTIVSQPLAGPPQKDVVPVEYLPVRDNRFLRISTAPLTVWQVTRMEVDAVYILTLDLLPWAVLANLLTRSKVFVYECNDEHDTMMLIREWLPRPARPILQKVFRWLEPALARQLDAATTALPATQEKFEQAGVNSVLVRNFPPAEIVTGRERAEDFRYDLLVGGSLAEDQIPLLADIAKRLEERRADPVRWLVVARNYGAREEQLLERALVDAGVRDRFDLRFNLPFTDMNDLMAACRIGFVLYPDGVNYASRIPIRIFEYMAVGMPFVASDLPTTAAFTRGHDVAELAPAGDPESLAQALGSLLDDPERQRQMSRNGPPLVRSEYNWQTESQKLVDLYRGLIGPPAAPS